MNAVDRDLDEDSQDSVDHLIVSLRAYVTRAPTKAKKSKGEEKPGQRPAGKKQFPPRIPPSDWVLVFDCETRTTPDQRLRFGAYQLRNKGRLFERGAFYEPEVLSAKDLTVLSKVLAEELETSDGERVRLLTRAQFVDQVLYGSGRDVGAQIVGFNLPFDISRLAIDHDSARRSMRGGFTFKLSEKEGRANVVVKHLSQKAALIRFAGEKPEKAEDETEETDPDTPHESEVPADPDRGYFVDLKTLAAALTGGSHSLAGLSHKEDGVGRARRPIDARLRALWPPRRADDLGMFRRPGAAVCNFWIERDRMLRLVQRGQYRQGVPQDHEDCPLARPSTELPSANDRPNPQRLLWRTRRGSYSAPNRPRDPLRFFIHVSDGLHAHGIVELRPCPGCHLSRGH
jgi:hypothetical protein